MNMTMERLQLEAEDESIKFYSCQIAAKYIQTRLEKTVKKRLGF